MKNQFFWKKIKKPIMVLAPMYEVADTAFRQTVAHYSKPDVVFSEFVSVDALDHLRSKEKISDFFLTYNKRKERPIVAQLWGSDPKKFEAAAKHICSLGFDGIDINMGCPVKNVVKAGGGSALIQKPKLAIEIIKATKCGAGELSVSVKTRIGFNKIQTKQWITALTKGKPDAIIVHGRTKKEMSKVPTHWDEIGTAAKIIKKAGIVAIGNGDIKNLKEAKEKTKRYGLDGIMVGRAVLGNPWFFDPKFDYIKIKPKQKINALIFHAKKFEQEFKGVKKFYRFRKIISGYVTDFPGAKELRLALMNAENSKEIKKIVDNFLGHSKTMAGREKI